MWLKSILWAALAFSPAVADSIVSEWRNWRQIDSGIPPNLKFHPQTKIEAKWSNNNTHIDLFGTEHTGIVYADTYDDVGYHGWWPIRPEVKAVVGSSVTALWCGNDHLNIFIGTPDGVVWQSTWERGGSSWTAWSAVRADSLFPPGVPIAAIALRRRPHGPLHIRQPGWHLDHPVGCNSGYWLAPMVRRQQLRQDG